MRTCIKHLGGLVCLCLPLLAQPDFTRTDVWQVGDTASYKAVNAVSAEPGPAGTGVTWDFSSLSNKPSEDYSVKYENPSAAPNGSDFPDSNLVATQSTGEFNAYSFFTVSNQSFILDGLDFPGLGVVTYTDKTTWVAFPLSLNETQTDNFVGNYIFSMQGVTATANRTGSITTTYDGFGTLIMPNGRRVENVRRLKIDQEINDVATILGLNFTTNNKVTTYLYYATDERRQLFQLVTDETTITPGTTSFSRNAAYLDLDGGTQNPGNQARRGTHLTAQGGNFDSEIIIRNPGASNASFNLVPYGSSGNELAAVAVTVPANGTVRMLQQAYFPADATSFAIDGCDTCTVSVGYRAALASASTAHVHQAQTTAQTYYFYPGEWDLLFDGAAIINAGNGPAKVEATQFGADGSQLAKVTLDDALPPNGKFLNVFNSLLQNDPNAIIKLESDQPLAVMILRISSDGRFLYQNFPLPADTSAGSSRWLAHITSGVGGFDTDIWIHNKADANQTVILQPFDSSGDMLTPVPVNLDANATRRFSKAELLAAETSHLSVSGSNDCVVTVGYRSQLPNSSTAPIHEAAPVGNAFTIFPGEWDLLFDGLALVNTGNTPTTITATQTADDGSTLQTVTLAANLAPNAKFLGVLEGLLNNNPNSAITIQASQPLAILALRLSKDSRFLYGNNLLP